MKTKKIISKLVLNKATVANLENDEMTAIKGGTISASTTSSRTTLDLSCPDYKCPAPKTLSECVCIPTN